MKILIIGGTRFVGLAISKEAVSRGHDVTIFHRGVTCSEGLDGVAYILGDRDSDLSGLENPDLTWDATIDVCGYRPHQIGALNSSLGPRGGKYIYISTISVYAEDTPMHSNENGKVVDVSVLDGEDTTIVPIDKKTYGPLKLLCENRAKVLFDDLLIIRPTYVFGPADYTMRFPDWIKKVSIGGTIDCPGPVDAPFQYIDARDQAAFIIDMVEKNATGIFNCCIYPEITFGQLLEAVVSNIPASKECSLNWINISEDDEKTAEYTLWTGSKPVSLMAMDSSSAIANGLKFRPLSETIIDTAKWLSEKK